MNTRFVLTLIVALTTASAGAQGFDAARIFAHNDYAGNNPFYGAYDIGVAYVEADVFLVEDHQLAVAHDRDEIRPDRTLAALYLDPLAKKVEQHNGSVYADPAKIMTLMIDLKTEGPPTLKAIVNLLQQYPQLLSCPTLRFMISGNVPDPADWKAYPAFITFDGRPGVPYTRYQLTRISMISTSFTQHVQWDGRSAISPAHRARITALIADAHAHGKPFRFWATPDFEEAWTELLKLPLDVIGTDHVAALAQFLTGRHSTKH